MVNIIFKLKGHKCLLKRCQWGGFFVSLFLLSFSPTPLLAFIKPPKAITVVYSKDCIPFYFQNDEKKPDGIIIDKWKLFAKKTGINIRFTPAAWKDTLRMVKNGSADAHAGLFFNTQRDTYLDYGPPLLTSNSHIFRNKHLSSQSDLKAFCIGVIKEDFSSHGYRPTCRGFI
ncbi:transporter substrate-binding domain-containing protein [uncultured Desulfobacter sp.]|uniref:transporter substrate-binding domain-containing protein n=1 Tax=uncultured Desulfobacter sp. TaxID=240139 RepID=UPI003748F415